MNRRRPTTVCAINRRTISFRKRLLYYRIWTNHNTAPSALFPRPVYQNPALVLRDMGARSRPGSRSTASQYPPSRWIQPHTKTDPPRTMCHVGIRWRGTGSRFCRWLFVPLFGSVDVVRRRRRPSRSRAATKPYCNLLFFSRSISTHVPLPKKGEKKKKADQFG